MLPEGIDRATADAYFGNRYGGDYEKALYEQALWILYGTGEQGVASFSLFGISQSFDLKGLPAHVAPRAWQFLKRGRSAGPVWLT